MDTRQNLESIANTHSRRDVLKQLGIVGAAVFGISTGRGIAYNLLVPQNAYAQVQSPQTDVNQTATQDYVAFLPLNGDGKLDTILLSWTQPDGVNIKNYEVQVGKQYERFSTNDVTEKDGKKQYHFDVVEGNNGETLPVHLKGNGYGTVIEKRANLTIPKGYTVLEKEKGEKLMGSSGEYYKFEVDFPSPKEQLWAYLVGTDKEGGVSIVYPDWSNDPIGLRTGTVYEVGGLYIAKRAMDMGIVPEGRSQVLLVPPMNGEMDGVKRLIITPSDLSAKLLETNTIVE